MQDENNYLPTQLFQDLTSVIKLFTLRLNSCVKFTPAPPILFHEGRRIATLYAETYLTAYNRKLIGRFISRAQEKVMAIQAVAGQESLEQIKRIKQSVSHLINHKSLASIIEQLLGIRNFEFLSVQKEAITQIQVNQRYPLLQNGLQNNKINSHNHECNKKDAEVFAQIYQKLDLNEQDLKRRHNQARQELERSSKYLYNEMLDRNAHTLMQIKQFQMEHKKKKNMQSFKKGKAKRILTENSKDQYLKNLSNFVSKEMSTKSKSEKEILKSNNFKRIHTNLNLNEEKKRSLFGPIKTKSSSAAYLTNERGMEVIKKGNAKMNSGSVFHMSKVHFMEASEVESLGAPKKLKEILISEGGRSKLFQKQEFLFKKCRLESILNKMKTTAEERIQNKKMKWNKNPILFHQEAMMICKGYQK